MPNYKEHYSGAYFKAEDFQDKPVKAAIARAELVKMNDGKEKVVVYLEGYHRGIVLNGTRYDQIVEITKTHETNDWVGARIAVYAGTTNFGGKRTACICIGSPKSQVAQRVTPKDLDDDIPFGDDDGEV